MLYILAIVMLLAGAIIAVGYMGREPREGPEPTRKDPR
jgi:hypothetical protein